MFDSLIQLGAMSRFDQEVGGIPRYNGTNARQVLDCATAILAYASVMQKEARDNIVAAYTDLYGIPATGSTQEDEKK